MRPEHRWRHAIVRVERGDWHAGFVLEDRGTMLVYVEGVACGPPGSTLTIIPHERANGPRQRELHRRLALNNRKPPA
jgi:hypothetical protein